MYQRVDTYKKYNNSDKGVFIKIQIFSGKYTKCTNVVNCLPNNLLEIFISHEYAVPNNRN